jgi:signal transduction histidine kinase
LRRSCAVALIPLVPRALAIPTRSRLENINRELERDVAECKRDISGRERAQVELAGARDEALEASRLKSVFVTNISHELRTPLNGIIGFSQLLYAGHIAPPSAEYKQSIGDILSSACHLLSLINDVLDLAKVETGKMEFTPEPIEPAALVEEVRRVVCGMAAQKNIQIEAAVAPQLGQLVLDCARLGRFSTTTFRMRSSSAATARVSRSGCDPRATNGST